MKKMVLLALTSALFLGSPSSVAAPLTGCEKADAMWNDKVLPTEYDMDALPALTSPGLRELTRFLGASFLAKSFTTTGDELPYGRRKLVHAWGTLARVKWVATGKGAYSGILASGAPCGIARFSLAQAPTKTESAPGLALKFFIDGNHPSSNIQVMYSIDGHAGHNFFEKPFSNIIPDAKTFATRLIAKLFSRGAAASGATDIAANHLKVTPLADTNLDGTAVKRVVDPYKLVFEPTDEAKAFMAGATVRDDFRVKLAEIPAGTKLYEVYAYATADSKEAEYVADLVTTSPVVAASYGDKKLFFKHAK